MIANSGAPRSDTTSLSNARTVRAFAYTALGIVYLHLVFGAIVRISGSGMGCGHSWPKCEGYWFPPMNRPDLIVEVSHRYLASILSLTVLLLAVAAWRVRHDRGIGGRGGALRTAAGALAVVLGEALLGALTVKESNAARATVAHLIGAMTVIALLAATAIRAGGLGGATAATQPGSRKTMRGAFAAAALALATVTLGGLTAKTPGAGVGCLSFPLCGPNPAISDGIRGIQLLHRTLAFLLVAHVTAMAILLRKRRATESPVVVRAATIALALVCVQFLVAGAMIGMHLPPALRSLHEATGVAIWLGTFTFAYLAKRAAR